MDGGGVLEHRAQEGNVLAHAAGDPATLPGHVDLHIVGEHLGQAFPVLGVHKPEVAGLQPLDGLDVAGFGHQGVPSERIAEV
jgi:hypothetical protein